MEQLDISSKQKDSQNSGGGALSSSPSQYLLGFSNANTKLETTSNTMRFNSQRPSITISDINSMINANNQFINENRDIEEIKQKAVKQSHPLMDAKFFQLRQSKLLQNIESNQNELSDEEGKNNFTPAWYQGKFQFQTTVKNSVKAIEAKISDKKNNYQFKTFTPKFLGPKKSVDSIKQNMVSVKKESSLTRMYEKSFINPEEQPSFENEVSGREAKQMFYKKGQNFERIIQMNQDSGFTTYFKKCSQQNIVPSPLGIANSKNIKNNQVQSAGQNMGDLYAQALGEGLRKSTSNPQFVNLSTNRLSDKGAVPILTQLANELKELDLSQNPKLQTKSYQILKNLITKDINKLLTLKLDKNNISDLVCQQICAHSISKMVTLNSSLKVLFIRWNRIRYKGGEILAKGLAQNKSIQIFDASFNAFGSGYQYQVHNFLMTTPKQTSRKIHNQSQQFSPEKVIVNEELLNTAQSFKQMFISNASIVHMDLSHNGFMEQEIMVMNEGLKQNHVLLGLHMLGNQKISDSHGFTNNQDQGPGASQVMTRLKPSIQYGCIKKRTQELELSQNCWLCDGWSQIMFQFNPMTSLHKLLDEFTPIYIHLSCDQYKPDLMERNEDGIYRLLRMIPPGSINYYFTIGNESITPIHAHDQKHREFTWIEKIDNRKLNVPITNYLENVVLKRPNMMDLIIEEMQELIRPPPREPPTKDKVKVPWDFKKSVFAKYQPDNEYILKQCFEFDLEISKISRVIKDVEEFNKTKSYLGKIYQHIRDVGQLIFQEILNNTNILDKELLTNSDLDLEFITTNAGITKFKYNPDRALVRYQFMEIFVRLALHKYYKSKICDSQYKAVVKMFEDDLLPYLTTFNCHDWRQSKLWTESCDMIFKAYMPVLKMLYTQNSGKWAKPGYPAFMSLDEFQQMLINSDIFSESFGTREVGIHFSLSKMTEVNEVDNEKHMQMQFIEFIEGLGRIAEKINIESLRQKFGMDEDVEDKAYLADSDSKLSSKIEFLIRLLMDSNLNVGGYNKKFKEANKKLESNIKVTKIAQEEAAKPPSLLKKVSMMTIMINRFRSKIDVDKVDDNKDLQQSSNVTPITITPNTTQDVKVEKTSAKGSLKNIQQNIELIDDLNEDDSISNISK
eukprot:403376781